MSLSRHSVYEGPYVCMYKYIFLLWPTVRHCLSAANGERFITWYHWYLPFSVKHYTSVLYFVFRARIFFYFRGMYVCVSVCMCERMYVCVCVCGCKCTCEYIGVYIHVAVLSGPSTPHAGDCALAEGGVRLPS